MIIDLILELLDPGLVEGAEVLLRVRYIHLQNNQVGHLMFELLGVKHLLLPPFSDQTERRKVIETLRVIPK